MVMSYPALMTMYAPGVISRVLDFTIPCYKSAVAVEANGVPSGKIFISTLRAADTDALNWQLIRETLLRFKILGPIDSYHLMWGKMDQVRNTKIEQILDLNNLWHCTWYREKRVENVA